MPEQGRPGGGGEGFFVNPYTFVPFPQLDGVEGFRDQPVGHERLGEGRYAGRVEVELTARAPLLMRGVTEDAPGSFPRRRFPGGTAPEVFLPGSGLAGAVRSLHETLVGGCLRVFGADFTPGYRDSAQARGPGWSLALVEEVDGDGRPTRLRWCRRVIWVPATDLAEVLGGPENVVTGARVRVDERQVQRQDFGAGGSGTTVTRDEAWETAISPGTSHVVLVTDTRVRNPEGNCWFAVGALEDGVVVDGVTEGAWKGFLNAVADTDDMRRARGAAREKAAIGQAEEEAKGPELAEVWFPPKDPAEARTPPQQPAPVPSPPPERRGIPAALVPKGALPPSAATPPKPTPMPPVTTPEASSKENEGDAAEPALVGFRHEVRRVLYPGQVLWAHAAGGPEAVTSLDELAVAHIWRHSGAGAAGERVPEWALPCKDHDDLCPTCRVFGSADTEGAEAREPGKARQDGYRGHLRFSDARVVGEAPVRAINLPPLGTPRPGAGQFYLDNTNAPSSASGIPAREWGSQADGRPPRKLRGRKYYWLTGRHQDRPFFRTPNEPPWPGKMGSRAELVEAGARFRFTVTFENLDLVELGGLLAALSPGQVLATYGASGDAYGFGIGGGRPLGFGACTTSVLSLTVDTARSWYADEPRPEVTPRQALDAIVAAVPKEQRDNWPALAAALRLDHVAPGAVWYPPAKAIPSGRLARENLDAGYDFWTRSRGALMRNKSHPLQSLPGILDADQRLPVLPEEGPGSTGRRPGAPPGDGKRGGGTRNNGRQNGGKGGRRS